MIVIFPILFSFTGLKKILLESIGKQTSALLEPEVLHQLLHYLREDEKERVEFSKEKYVSEKEIYALQCLADYVFSKLYEKFKMAEKKYD